MINKLLPLLVLFLAAVPALAETVDTAWVRTYDGYGDEDEAHAIAVDDSGNVYVTGWSYHSGFTNPDYATVKYHPNGDTAWVRRYNGPGNGPDQAYAIAVDDSGNIYVTGESFGNGTYEDFATIKYKSNGDTVWVRRYDGGGIANSDKARAIAVDDSGNVYVTGSGGPYGFGYVTMKYYPDGDTAWTSIYPTLHNGLDTSPYDIAVDDCGNVYVTGHFAWIILTPPTVFEMYKTVRYDRNGYIKLDEDYDTGAGDVARAIAIDDSGNIYVAGTGGTIKYDSTGNQLWVKTECQDGVDIAVDAFSDIYVTGPTYYPDNASYDYTIVRYCSNGDTAWVRRYDGPISQDDYPSALALDTHGNVYATGYSMNASWEDYATVKYDSNGNQVWAKRFEGGSVDKAYAIAVDDSDNVYVTGTSWSVGVISDFVTIKYVQTSSDVKDEPARGKMPSEFTLSQNYPNPFNASTKIGFALKNPGFVSLNIYDILGRKIKTLVSEDLPVGYKSLLWDGKDDSGSDVASGSYFYRIKAGDFTESKKLVLLK